MYYDKDYLMVFDDKKPHLVNPANIRYTALQYTGDADGKIELYRFVYGKTPDIFDLNFFVTEHEDQILFIEDGKLLILAFNIEKFSIQSKKLPLETGDIVVKVEQVDEDGTNYLLGYLLYSIDDFTENVTILDKMKLGIAIPKN